MTHRATAFSGCCHGPKQFDGRTTITGTRLKNERATSSANALLRAYALVAWPAPGALSSSRKGEPLHGPYTSSVETCTTRRQPTDSAAVSTARVPSTFECMKRSASRSLLVTWVSAAK